MNNVPNLFVGFSQAFWLFLGLIAGTLIQTLATRIDHHRQASAALRVLQIEIEHNLEEADRFVNDHEQLVVRLLGDEIKVADFYFRTFAFDYSGLGTLNNSGFLHYLLGARHLKAVLAFQTFFSAQNGELLKARLNNLPREQWARFLQDVKLHSLALISEAQPILLAKKKFGRLALKFPTS